MWHVCKQGAVQVKLPGYILGVGGWLRKKILPTDFRPLVETGWSSLILVPQSRGGGGWKKHFVGINFPNNCAQLVEIKAIKNDEKISTIFFIKLLETFQAQFKQVWTLQPAPTACNKLSELFWAFLPIYIYFYLYTYICT